MQRPRLVGWTVAILLATLISAPVAAQEWTRFRGPNGSGIASSASVPEDFEGDGALLWSAEVPFGRSSPAVAGDRIFLTGVDDDRLVTLAVARSSGEILWQRGLERTTVAELHQATDSATPSPATDGENVYAFFHESGLVSYDKDGRERWRLALGPFRNFYGMAASPIVVGELVIQLCDQAAGSFLLAVDRESGREVWRRNRVGRRESYTTPTLYPSPAEPTLLLVLGSKHLDAYDPRSGELAWTVPGLGAGPISSPVVDGDRVYVVAPDHTEEPFPPFASLLEQHDEDEDGRLSPEELAGVWMAQHFGWLDFDGDGGLSTEDWAELNREVETDDWGLQALKLGEDGVPAKLWNYRKNVSYIPTLLVHDGVVYMLEDSILTSLDALSGEVLKRGRVGAGKIYASPIAAGGRILIGNLDGELFILRAGGEWEVERTHDLEDAIYTAPAFGHAELYLRTRHRLLAYAAGTNVEDSTASP